MTIEEIVTREEGQTFDCKSIQISPKALAIPVVAFANADGGLIAIGISDKTRKIEGVDQYTDKLNELMRVPFDYCNPSVSATFSYLDCTDKNGNANHILLMEIPASSSLHTNQADEAYMRVGDKSRKLTFDERLQLLYDKGQRYFEDTAVYGATINDIDMDAVAEYAQLVGYSKSPTEYVRENNHFVFIDKHGEEQISASCILLFGKRPQQFFPRARTRFIRYYGVDERVGTEMNVIKDVTFEGTILNQIRKTVEYLETQVAEHTYLGQSGLFVTRRDYPEYVIQEMTVNACCHRSYNITGTEIQIKMFDDRIVFESPGRMPNMVKPSNIRTTHFSRNPKIAAFLKAYKYVKEFGEGVDRMSRELEANGTPPLSFHLDDFILKITVPRLIEVAEKVTENVGANATVNATVNVTVNHQGLMEKLIERALSNGEKLSKNQITILKLMIEKPYITKKELSKTIGIHETTVMRNIEAMRGKYLRRVGSDKNGFWEMLAISETENEIVNETENEIVNEIEAEQKPNKNRTEGGRELTEVGLAILRLIAEDPYISKARLAKGIGVAPVTISRNIEALRGKYLRRVGPDKGGFWEIIK